MNEVHQPFPAARLILATLAELAAARGVSVATEFRRASRGELAIRRFGLRCTRVIVTDPILVAAIEDLRARRRAEREARVGAAIDARLASTPDARREAALKHAAADGSKTAANGRSARSPPSKSAPRYRKRPQSAKL